MTKIFLYVFILNMITFNTITSPVIFRIKNNNISRQKINFRSKDTFEKSYECYDVFCELDNNSVMGNYPADYIYEKSGKHFLKPYYYILNLESFKKGGGTMAIKNVVRKSLKNPLSEGRVIVHSADLIPKKYSAGFYYKLGFRFTDEEKNKILQNWLSSGGRKENSPSVEGLMYLPKENIEHCLNY